MVRRFALASALLAVLAVTAFAQSDVEGARDHPDIPRYEGAFILGHETSPFERRVIPTGPAVRDGGEWTGETSETVEGTTTRLLYVAPRERSTLEVFENYRQGLQERGLEVIFACSGQACGANEAMGRRILWTRDRQLSNAGDRTRYALTGMHDDHYLAARNEDGSLWTSIYVARNDFSRTPEHLHPIVLVDVVEAGMMETRMIDASEMARSIEETGRIALDNVYFEFGEATLEARSDPALTEMGRLLTENPAIEVYIVGHTDNVGSLDGNLDLSRRRAQAVVDALVSRSNIAADRIVPAGVGPLAPLASNEDEAGRARNRRVELVLR